MEYSGTRISEVAVALRHALLANLLDGAATGYDLARRFAAGSTNYWHVRPAQLYAELSRMEAAGLVGSETVAQERRPNKRLYRVAVGGLEELRRYACETSERTSVKDELLVKVKALGVVDHDALLRDISARRSASVAQLELYESIVAPLLRGRDEARFARESRHLGTYLTLRRGIGFEQENIRWCDEATKLVAARQARGETSSQKSA